MSTAIETKNAQVARPLKTLVPLIREQLDAGDSAGVEHYRKAGEMLIEAKGQVAHGEWTAWVERNFHRSAAAARQYMLLAEKSRSKTHPGRVFESVRQAARPDAPNYGPRWTEPVRQVVSRVNVEALSLERQNREKEERLISQLALQLIDIGYKVLAAKLHPDKPDGSREGMARLNKVRTMLKDAI